MAEYNIEKAIKAQEDLCMKKCYPMFAPSNGKCYRCGDNIYAEKLSGGGSGYSVEKAGTEFITGCPNCNWSFCE